MDVDLLQDVDAVCLKIVCWSCWFKKKEFLLEMGWDDHSHYKMGPEPIVT